MYNIKVPLRIYRSVKLLIDLIEERKQTSSKAEALFNLIYPEAATDFRFVFVHWQ